MSNFAKKLIVVFLISSFQLLPLTLKAQTQSAVVITADQPNIWTLEQAHYLLAQMHRRNLDLRASPLSDLDSNVINGVNIDVLKTLLEVSAEYDEAKGFNNSLRKDQKQYDAQRKQQLTAKRSQLQDESLNLTRQIAELKIKIIQTEDEDEKKATQAQANELEIVQSAVKEQINQINTEIGTLNSVTGDFEKTSPTGGFDSSKFSNSLDGTFGSAVKSVIDSFNQSPQLNASLRLENYLQMQYEILSKQLTLLRDEVGPGERLIFLEMPQSIRSTYDKADNKWAQSWWKIRAYTTCEEIASQYESTSEKIGDAADELQKINKQFDDFHKQVGEALPSPDSDLETNFKSTLVDLVKAAEQAKAAADFGKITGKALGINTVNEDSNTKNEFYQAEKAAARSQLEKMLKQALVVSNRALVSLNKFFITNKIADKIVYPKDTNKQKNLQNSIASTQQNLLSTVSYYKKRKLQQAHLSWLRLKIQDIVVPVSDLITEIDENLKGLESEQTGNILAPIMLSTIGNSNIVKSCENSLDDYKDTASAIKSVIQGDDYRRVVAIDLDEKIDLNKEPKPGETQSPLFEILKTDLNKITRQSDSDKNGKGSGRTTDQNNNESKKTDPLQFENREARIVDLFPRQSSLNVNDIKYRSNAFSLKLIFSLITGFGANGSYQRSRERYSQFVQQELYSSAFGKGSREFGWTFNPMPGTKRLLSGVRTTYAIMVVPRKATTILLQSTGCYFKRSERQLTDFENALDFHEADRFRGKGDCSDSKSFVVPIPTAIAGENSFWVKKIEYRPVEQNKKVVVSIRGKDFSTQIGVLVDGVSLKPSLGLGQPYIVDDSRGKDIVIGEKDIKGSFERIDSEQIIATFEMGKDYKGTPTITLIAPGRGLVLNTIALPIFAYNTDSKKFDNFPGLMSSPYMFGEAPNEANAKIETVKLFKATGTKKLTAVITGKKLLSVNSVDVSGFDCDMNSPGLQTESLIRCTFDNLGEKKLFLTLLYADKEKSLQSAAIDNPVPDKPEPEKLPSFATYTVDNNLLFIQKAEFENVQPIENSTDTYVIFKLTGKGFTEEMRFDKGEYQYINDSEAFFKIEKSKTPLVITLIDDKNTRKVRIGIKGIPLPKTKVTETIENSKISS